MGFTKRRANAAIVHSHDPCVLARVSRCSEYGKPDEPF